MRRRAKYQDLVDECLSKRPTVEWALLVPNRRKPPEMSRWLWIKCNDPWQIAAQTEVEV